jgi:hypothetical protein
MTITVTTNVHDVNIHGVTDMTAHKQGITEWLKLTTAKGEAVYVFMYYDMACEIADLWKHMNREPEPQTFDEALAAKCDADARMDEARVLKGMV